MKTRFPLATAAVAAVLLGVPAAYAQLPATFTPDSLPLTGFKTTVHITVTSPYDDCTMAITTQVNPANLATVDPPGPVVGLGPFTYAITTGTVAGSGTLIFIIRGDPGNCVQPTQYNIPLSVKDVNGGSPPHHPYGVKQVIEPVDMSDGAYVNTYLDLRLRGPLPIRFERSYDSSLGSSVSSALGTNWMHNYDVSLTTSGSTATVNYELGEAIQFTNTAGVWSNSSGDPLGYQLQSSGTTYQFLDPFSKLIYTFDGTTGELQTIKDRRGNTQTLTYTNKLLSHVADGLGGTLDFTYSGANLSKVTDQSGRSIAFTYAGGTLASFTDAGGKATSYAYTGAGLMTSYTLPRGNTPYTNTFNSANQVATQKDALNNLYQFAFNSAAGTGTMTDPLLGASTYTHVNGVLTQSVDPLNDTSTIAYDSNNRPITTKDEAGRTTSNTYNPAGLLASTTFPDGSRITYSYVTSTAGGFSYYDISSITFEDGSTESRTYDSAGNLVSRTDRAGQTWRNTYDSHGLPLVLTAPDGSKTTFTYTTDGLDNLVSIQFASGALSTFKVDALKRITSRQHSDGAAYSYTYDSYDNVLTTKNELGGVTTNTYDANGNPATVTDPDGGVTTITRNALDLMSTVTDGAGRTLTIKYDSLNRPVVLQYADGSTFTTGFDAAGNITSVTDGAGKVWKATFDASGIQTSFTSPLGNKTAYTLAPAGQIAQMTSAASRVSAFAYDKTGNLNSYTDPLQKVTTYTYDKDGHLAGTTAPLSLAATYARDSLGDLAGVTDPAGNQWKFTYDGTGQLLTFTDPLGRTQTYSRDAQGRVSGATLPVGSVTTKLDAAGNVTNSTYADGTSIDMAWDPAGRLTSATGITSQYDPSGSLIGSNGLTMTRDKLDRVTQVTLAPGKTVTYAYDPRGLVTSVTDWLSGVTTLKYDDNERLTSITRPNGVVTTYTYDADDYTTGVQDAAGSTQLSQIALTRDARGNVTQATRTLPLNPTAAQVGSVQSIHTFDAAGQIKEYQYDAGGRRISDDAATYTWDQASRLLNYKAGSASASFTYNGLGLVASQNAGGVTSQYVWNFGLGLPSISVVRNGPADVTYYIHTPDGKLLHSVDAASGKRNFYHFDEMGSSIFLTDDTGAVTDKYAYTEYGALLAPSGGTSNPFLFGGRYGAMQLGAGLYSMRLRVYDSRNGVFLSPDSQVHLAPQTMNAYAYAAGNPLQFVDVSGADPTTPGNGTPLTFPLTPIYPVNPTLLGFPYTILPPTLGGGLGLNPILPTNGFQLKPQPPFGSGPAGPAGGGPPPNPASGQTGSGSGQPPISHYQDVINRINGLYKKGKITAIQRNRLLLYAKQLQEDEAKGDNSLQNNTVGQSGTVGSNPGVGTFTPIVTPWFNPTVPGTPLIGTGFLPSGIPYGQPTVPLYPFIVAPKQ